jgi:hypothetical protein
MLDDSDGTSWKQGFTIANGDEGDLVPEGWMESNGNVRTFPIRGVRGRDVESGRVAATSGLSGVDPKSHIRGGKGEEQISLDTHVLGLELDRRYYAMCRW